MRRLVLIVTCFLIPFQSGAVENPLPTPPWWSLQLPKEGERPRSDLFSPFVSLLVPGSDQFYEGQWKAGGLYFGYALLGISQISALQNTSETEDVLTSDDDSLRRSFLGAQMIQTAGSLSAFHSFRSAVESRKSHGEYSFLSNQEDSADLIKAPFRFDFLKRKTTWVVLGAEAILLAIGAQNFSGSTQFTSSDAAYTAGFSYQAGVGEEAVYRGWLMPYAANAGLSPQMSNLLTATAFSLAHISSANPVPWPQFLLGYYFGQVALWNNWSIQESIFIHTWWDVLAIGASFATSKDDQNKAVYIPLIDHTF